MNELLYNLLKTLHQQAERLIKDGEEGYILLIRHVTILNSCNIHDMNGTGTSYIEFITKTFFFPAVTSNYQNTAWASPFDKQG